MKITTVPYTSDPALSLPDPRWERPAMLIPGRKPVGPVEIDWTHPLAQELLYCVIPEFGDLVSGGRPIKYGSSSLMLPSQNHGIGFESNATSGSGYYIPAKSFHEKMAGASQYSCAVILRIDSLAGWSNLGSARYTTTNTTPFKDFGLQQYGATGSFTFKAASSGADIHGQTTTYSVSSALQINDGKFHCYAATRRAVSPYLFFFVDGIDVGTDYNIFGGSGTYASANKLEFVFMDRNPSSTGEGVNGNTAFFCCWRRDLTDEEMFSFANDPYQFLIPA